MSDISISGHDELAALIVKAAKQIPNTLKDEFKKLPERIRTRAIQKEWQTNWAGAAHLGHVTGRLKTSVKPIPTRIYGDEMECGISADTEYAAIHEFGGTTSAHTITRTKDDGTTITFEHPGSRIREKRYLRNPAEHESLEAFPKRLTRAIEKEALK